MATIKLLIIYAVAVCVDLNMPDFIVARTGATFFSNITKAKARFIRSAPLRLVVLGLGLSMVLLGVGMGEAGTILIATGTPVSFVYVLLLIRDVFRARR
jgi:hypothetical protein